jgi:ABC-type sugar transport system substrate-binding protein
MMTLDGNAKRLFRGFLGATMLVAVGFVCSARAADRDPRDSTLPGDVPNAVKKAVEFDKAGKKLDKPYRIGYLTECVTNTYCEARLKGLKDASEKYGFTFKIFDANFNPQAQLKHVQNAVQENFDGYLSPTADAAGCKMWKDYLVPTNKPVVSLDLTMCGDVTYTPGLAGTVTMQSQPYFDFHIEHAFAEACKGRAECKGVSLSGFAGSDLFARWERQLTTA